MSKVHVHQVLQEQIDSDIWSADDVIWWHNEYSEDYWDGVHSGEMSWQWYMKLSQHKDWYHVTISPAHKNVTVANWLRTEYPGAGFEYEHEHFIIEQHNIATLVALKWA